MNDESSKVEELNIADMKTINGGVFGFDVGWFIRVSFKSAFSGPAGYVESAVQYGAFYATR